MNNYFNYFTEIEEHFQRRRGTLLLLSTLDWALIETWRETGIPLAAVLRGIDTAFDKHDARKAKGRTRRINGLAWCTQEVFAAVEEMQEASVGSASSDAKAKAEESQGFEQAQIAAHLEGCAGVLRSAKLSGLAQQTGAEIATLLEEFAAETRARLPRLEELERKLGVMEEKFFAVLTATAPEQQLIEMREQAARELAPYRSRMQAVQIRQIEQQFLHKRLLESLNLPRLSLFYMSQS